MIAKKNTATLEKVLAFQKLNREWRGHLNIYERDFVLWFIDATWSYDRTSLTATAPQMVTGMVSKRTGKVWLPKIEQSLSTVERVLKSLRKRGLIVSTRVTSRVTHFTINLNWNPDMALAVPKRAKNLNPGAQNDPESAICPVSQTVQNTNLPRLTDGPKPYREGKPYSNRRERSGSLSGEEVIAEIKAKPRKTKVADEVARMYDLWRQGWVAGEHTGVPPMIDKSDSAILYKAHARVPDTGDEFIVWSITHWREVVAEHFTWMKAPVAPKTPNPRFLLGQVRGFLEAYARYRREGALRLMPEEQREYEQLRATRSHDDAILEIGKRRAVGLHREEFARQQREIALQHRVLARAAKTVQRPASVPRRPAPPPLAIDHGDNPYDNPTPDLSAFEQKYEDYE